ncbi:M24 family metallopeptidase [Pseudomonas vranovensis]|uniref:M24 family metallopeptidase n=1 Tax=Pseudomonas vranovensis TaxID=321661 RepID=UPI003D997217
MHETLRPGHTENNVWAELHAGNIRRGVEWIKTRILSSGPRTNPWFQESGPRVINEGDLVSFDTDLIGTYGMCVDISRSGICGGSPPTAEQRRLYQIAHEHVMTSSQLVRPGV